MADIPTRLGVVERDQAALKARVDASEEVMGNLPDVIKPDVIRMAFRPAMSGLLLQPKRSP